MKTVTKQTEQTYRIKGSKFIGRLFPVANQDEFEHRLNLIKKEHPTATHHCYGWRILPETIRLQAEKPGASKENTSESALSKPVDYKQSQDIKEFSSDDGEPSGTAGVPIINHLKSANLLNAAVVVIRYYGGTKLGKPGLIDAYGETTRLCISIASLKTLYPTIHYRIRYPYTQQNLIDSWRNRFNLMEKESEYLESVHVVMACPEKYAGKFAEELSKSKHKLLEVKMLGGSFEIF